jgi:hypothetical protein
MPMRRTYFLLLVVLLIVVPAHGQERSWPTDILRDTFGITSQSQIDAPIEEVFQGCPRRDCIPSIDDPSFVAAGEAENLAEEDLVLGLEYDGVVRAYPAFILNFHEVVNDRLDGDPIAVTFCPLCGSGVAFRRLVDGRVTEFGVSGLLHNSDLVLYDRASESLWQQITGEALAGPLRGRRLEAVPLTMTTWSEWRAAHPETAVLTGVPGASYANKTPYGDYEESERLMFPAHTGAASVLHPKQIVHGVRFNGGAAAVSERALRAEPEIRTTVAGVELLWRRHDNGRVEVRRGDGEEPGLVPIRMFWFAWYSFNTDTALRDLETSR